MRTIQVGLVLALVCLATPARAGLYNSLEGVPQIPPGALLKTIKDLRSLEGPLQKGAQPTPGTIRFNYQTQLEQLEALRQVRPLTITECADLGACYIRFKKIPRALETLRNQGDNKHFLLQANLAVAYAEDRNWHQAARAQKAALGLWPSVHAGWSRQQLAWNRHVDRYFLRLLEARMKEQDARERTRTDRGAQQLEQLDPIFPDVKFVGSDGKTYEAGALDQGMADLLPPDALQIVIQLVVWFPHDQGLCWLLAEVLNANGLVEPAAEILDYLRDKGFNPPGLHEHRRVLMEAAPIMRELRDPSTMGQLLGALTLPPLLAPPGVGAIAQGTEAGTALALLPQLGQRPPPNLAPDSPGVSPNVLPNWKHVTVGFLAGGLVAFLLGLQWQEWTRRRRTTTPIAPPPIPEGSEAGWASGQQPSDSSGITQTLPSSRDPAET
jgi:hypothetical protein